MDKVCACHQPPRSERRTNGLQFPLHIQQIVGWFMLLLTAAINFLILVPIQFYELKITSEILYTVLYTSHIIFHLFALFLDPAEKTLRESNCYTVPEFDRSLHVHVIENGRCHLCNIQTSSIKTKHCSTCNKCVDDFDHHCKWLNNCIGRRNYKAFLLSVVTAALISSFTAVLCFCDVIFFISYVHLLSPIAQKYIVCKSEGNDFERICLNSIMLVCFLVIFCLIALSISCALLHLCCFHVYLNTLGVSTYEYVMRPIDAIENSIRDNKGIIFCQSLKIGRPIIKIKSEDNKVNENDTFDNRLSTPTEMDEIRRKPTPGSKSHVAYLINSFVNEVGKAKKIVLYENNKIHPDDNEMNSNFKPTDASNILSNRIQTLQV